MTTEPVREPDSSSRSDLSASVAKSMLALAIEGSRRPIEDVIDRLAEDDGMQWLANLGASHGLASAGLTFESLITGEGATLDRLNALKDWSKSQITSGASHAERNKATLLYFLALASAFAHHGRSISSMDTDEIIRALEDLAPMLPDRERDMVARGIGRAGHQ